MSITDLVLLLCLLLSLAYAVYDEFIMQALHGKTRLRVDLKRANRLDALIFIGLIAILIYKNISGQGAVFTTTLLLSLAFMAIYLAYIRWPKALFKDAGFFYGNIFIPYHRIRAMNLSEDGVLVIDLEKRRLLIQVKELDDLEKIYHFMIENQ